MELLRRISGPFKEFGAGLGALYVLDRVLRKLPVNCGIYPYAFVVQAIPDKSLLPPALARNGRAERLSPGSALLEEADLPATVVAQRFARGDGGVAALRKENLVGYAWWASRVYPESEVSCLFEWMDAPRAVFDFDVYVKPEHRMGLGFMAVWDSLLQELRQSGVELSYSRISRFNLASLRAHARLGARPIGQVTFLRLGAVMVAFSRNPMAARLGWVGAKSLRLRLSTQGVRWVSASDGGESAADARGLEP